MGKQFRGCNLNQQLLLPVSLHDWLPEGHLARFVAEVVEASLNLGVIETSEFANYGRPGYLIIRDSGDISAGDYADPV
jgi:hypothetical protein